MGKESTLWNYLKQGMGARWNACRHEDMITPGVPDVSYALDGVHGWIELKVLDAWPTNNGVVKIDSFTSWQRRWLQERGRIAAYCWLLLKVNRPKVFLLVPWHVVHNVGKWSVNKLVLNDDVIVWSGSINWDELVYHLTIKT
jgi:hypothetical protein